MLRGLSARLIVLLISAFFATDSARFEVGAQTQEETVWRSIIEANKAWLSPSPHDVSYQHSSGQAGQEDQTTQVWLQGENNACIEQSVGESQYNMIYADGVRGIIRDRPYHDFNQEIPDGYRVGFSLEPLILEVAQDDSPPPSLHIVGRRSLDGRDVLLIEAPEFSGYSGAGVDVNSLSRHSVEGVRWYVDPESFLLVREEGLAPPAQQRLTNDGLNSVWEFPEGFYDTPEGPVPKSMVWKSDRITEDRRIEFDFQLVDGDVWLGKEARSYVGGNLRYTGKIENVSTAPIDPSKFDLAAAGVEISDPTEGTGSISGRVLDLDSKMPIWGADVRLCSHPRQSRKTNWGEMQTGPDGTFQFGKLPALPYYLTAERSGFVGGSEPGDPGGYLEVEDVNLLTQAVQGVILKEESREDDITLFLAKSRSLKGRVVEGDSDKPIPDANVACGVANVWYRYSDEATHTARTDKNGEFEFTGLSAREHVLGVQADGYFSPLDQAHFSIRHMKGQEKNYDCLELVDLSSNRSVDNVVLRLNTTGTIQGKVLSPNGNPVPNAVLAWNSPFPLDRTDSTGSYKITGLPTTRERTGQEGVQLIAAATGYLETRVGPIPIPPNAGPVTKDITLKAGGTVQGFVKDKAGEPIPGTNISFQKQQEGMEMGMGMYGMGYGMGMMGMLGMASSGHTPPTSDKEGRFESHPLYAGKYIVKAATDGYQPGQVSDVEVKEGQATEITIELDSIPPIAGIVIGPTGQALRDVVVRLAKEEKPDPLGMGEQEPPSAAFYVPEIRTATDGRFSFKQLQSGEYKLTAKRDAPRGMVDQKVEIENLKPGRSDIEVRFEEPFKVRPVLKGKVVDGETKQPIEKFKISLFGNMTDLVMRVHDEGLSELTYRGTEFSDSKGEFVLDSLPPDKLEFVVSAAGYAARAIGPFDLQPEQVKEITVRLEKEGIISGRVYSPDLPKNLQMTPMLLNRRTADVKAYLFHTLWLYPSNGGMEFEFEKDGRFTIRRVPTGVFDLYLQAGRDKIAGATCLSATQGIRTDIGTLPLKGPEAMGRPESATLDIKKADGSPWPEQKFDIYWTPENTTKDRKTDSEGRYATGIKSYQPSEPIIIAVGESPQTLYEWHLETINKTIVYSEPKGEGIVSGLVLTKGKPLIAKPITLVSKTGADPYLYFEAKTNLLGRFKITDVPDGEYCLLLRENNRDSVFRMKRVRVEAGKSEYNKISLEGVSLAGEVLDKRGVPVSGAHVQIGFPFEHTPITRATLGIGPARSMRTDEDGRFSFSNLQSGTYEIWASRYSIGISEKQYIEIGEENAGSIKIKLK